MTMAKLSFLYYDVAKILPIFQILILSTVMGILLDCSVCSNFQPQGNTHCHIKMPHANVCLSSMYSHAFQTEGRSYFHKRPEIETPNANLPG